MSFNSYITFDGKKYSTLRNWQPVTNKPVTIRQLANGELDVTYGAAIISSWEGEISAYITDARSGYGTSSDIETSLNKLQGVTFVDHYGISYTVHIQQWKKRSLHSDWSAASNKFFYMVRLIADA